MAESIGNKIRNLRRSQKMSQEQLGSLLSYTGSYISLIESGDRVLSDFDLKKIANIFNVSPAHFKFGCHFRSHFEDDQLSKTSADKMMEEFINFAKNSR